MILQGSFPGGVPHSSVLLNNRTDFLSCAGSSLVAQTLMRHPNNMIIQLKQNSFKRDNFTSQSFHAGNNTKAYPVNISRLNLSDKGAPLDEDVLQFYEAIFDKDLSGVMIHEGDGSAEAAGALAFTSGNDIYFATGRYNPDEPDGLRLIGHELTHVIQQKEGRVKNPADNKAAFIYDPILEAEAERIGHYSVSIAATVDSFDNLIQMTKKRTKPIWSFPRSSTFYTYLSTPSTRKIGKIKQGPHTISHSFTDYTYYYSTKGKNRKKMEDFFLLYVPRISKVRNMIDKELCGSDDDELEEKLTRYFKDYKKLYNEIKKDFAGKTSLQSIKRKIRKIMEMHPYQTYRWHDLDPTKEDLKTHGEIIKGSLTKEVNECNYRDLKRYVAITENQFAFEDKFKDFLEQRLSMGDVKKNTVKTFLKKVDENN
jgi:hypothetical protein